MRNLLTFRHDSASEIVFSAADLIEKPLWASYTELLTQMLIGLRHGLGRAGLTT